MRRAHLFRIIEYDFMWCLTMSINSQNYCIISSVHWRHKKEIGALETNESISCTISNGRSTIEFYILSECPTGHLTGVTIETTDDV